MPRPFYQVTAEKTIAVVEAVFVKGAADCASVERFCEWAAGQAGDALRLAVDLGLLSENGGVFEPRGPLARFATFPGEQQKASVLRIVLESYEPFNVFRQRLQSTDSADRAARQTKDVLELDAHPEQVKETLVSLGTYARALSHEGGGRYRAGEERLPSDLEALAGACADHAAAELCVREHIGPYAERLSRNHVIVPLATALMSAKAGDAAGAVTQAGNAIESYLAELAGRLSVSLEGASGIIEKLGKLRAGGKMPKKLSEAGKYLGQVRNAADHGIDPDENASWVVLDSTGLQYVYVACNFIVACGARETSGPLWI